MTTLYVINLLSNSNGFHIVHKYGCADFPDNFYEIGLYESCTAAVKTVKEILPNATCCPACITGCKDPDHQEKRKFAAKRLLNH